MSLITQISMDSLANPDQLTTGFALILIGIFGILGYMAIKMKSIITMFSWTMAVFTFIISVLFNVSFVWFWTALAFAIAMAFIGLVVGVRFNASV